MDLDTKKVWQWAFLLGIAACGGAAILAYGFSTITAIISGATVTIGILTGLYGLLNQQEKDSPGTNSLPAKLATTLNVNKFLKFATAGIWIAAIGLGIVGAKQTYLDYLEAQKITIEGLVLSAGGDPADNATVTLFMSNRQEIVTAPGGKFIFSKVDVRNEPSKVVRLRASWHSQVAEITTDLTNGPPKGLTIKLPPGDPPFRITYFMLKGQAIDFLLHHKMNAEWEEKFGGQPFIVPNEVSKKLYDLLSAYSEEAGYTDFEIENKGTNKSYGLTPEGSLNEKFFTGSDQFSSLNLTDPSELISSMKDEQQPWRVFYSKSEKKISIESLVFRKFIDRKDLNLCTDSLFKSFYQHITKDYMPRDFAYVNVYFQSDGCGDDDSGIKYVGTQFVGRSLGLLVAVVENVLKESINLDNFAIKINSQDRLRTRDEDKAILDSLPMEERTFFPQRMLIPGEKIIVPLAMPLSFEKNEFSSYLDEGAVTQDIRGSIMRELRQLEEIQFPVYERNSIYTVSAQAVENILNRRSQDFRLNKEYLYGPSLRIEKLEVDKVAYPFRQFDSKKIIITGGSAMGSCPYVYTYSPELMSWRNEGVILYGINRKDKETKDEKRLHRFDGRVLIKEKDPEDSFIDAVYVREIRRDGSERTLYPENVTLRFVDHNYVRLAQGEDIEIDFGLSGPSPMSKYILGMVGYYVPHENASVTRGPFSSRKRYRSKIKVGQ